MLDRGQMGDIRGSANTSLGGLHHPRSPVIIINLNVASTKIYIQYFSQGIFQGEDYGWLCQEWVLRQECGIGVER